VFAAIFEWLWERHRLTTRWVVSTAIAVTGVVLLGLFGRVSTASGGTLTGLGVALGLLAGLAYALYTYSSTRAIRAGNSGRAVMGGTFGLGAIGLIPVLLVFGAPILRSVGNIGIATYLAVFPMFVAYLLFGIGVRALRSSVVTTITLLEPVVATILAVTIVGERLTVLGWLGIFLILVGVSVLVAARPTRKPDQSP
jgi:DME family drug/metabolite transporter